MFHVKVVGQYVARSGVMEKEKVKKNYEIEGNIPTVTAALSVVKNKLLAPALAKKYPDYVTYLTYNIVEIVPLDEKSKASMRKVEISFMDRATIIDYVKDNALPVQVEYYPNLFRLREAVQLAKEDPKGYKKQFALREPDLRLDLEMAQANPELFESGGANGFVASVGNTPAQPKASNSAQLAKKTDDRLAGLAAEQIRDGDMAPMDDEPPVLEPAPEASNDDLEVGDL